MKEKIYLDEILQENIANALKWAPKVQSSIVSTLSENEILQTYHFNPQLVEKIECNLTNVIELMYQAMGATLREYHAIISETLEKQGIELDDIHFPQSPFDKLS